MIGPQRLEAIARETRDAINRAYEELYGEDETADAVTSIILTAISRLQSSDPGTCATCRHHGPIPDGWESMNAHVCQKLKATVPVPPFGCTLHEPAPPGESRPRYSVSAEHHRQAEDGAAMTTAELVREVEDMLDPYTWPRVTRKELLSMVSRLAKELSQAEKDLAILRLAVPLEDELSDRIDAMCKHLATEQGFTLSGIARLLIDCQHRMAADWIEVGRARRAVPTTAKEKE